MATHALAPVEIGAPRQHVELPAPQTAGRIGPNTVTQLTTAIIERLGPKAARPIFLEAGAMAWLVNPPQTMVDEVIPVRLFAAVRTLHPEDADAILSRAGTLTGDYILAHRIPRVVQRILKALPPRLAARLLTKAILKHAWTFAGSGDCTSPKERSPVILIAANPIATPGCPWHSAVLQRLYETLTGPTTRVRHSCCCAHGAKACRFEILTGQDEGDRP